MADTPLMIQYREMKQQYADMILFFRLGDFYEMFDSDAKEVSSLLNLTLTHRGNSPMCGIPYHAAKNYIKRLLDFGKKIAICEQLELSNSSKSLAKREVVRIITPATVVEDDFLDNYSFSYILCVLRNYCAYCDITTGDFRLKTLDEKNRIESLRTLIQQISPKEILICEDEYYLDKNFKDLVDASQAMITKLAPWYFSQKNSYKILCDNVHVSNLQSFGLEQNNKLIGPAGCLLKYISETSKQSISNLTNYKIESDDNYLLMDDSSRKNLEIFTNLSEGNSKYTLFETINRCRTSGGTRLLKSYLSFPLADLNMIKERQDWVTYFYENKDELSRINDSIANARDLSRLVTRVVVNKAVPHDLVSIKQSIGTFFDIVSKNVEKYSGLFDSNLSDNENLQNTASLMNVLDRAINEDFLGQFNEGEVILDGYDVELDEKRELINNSDDILKKYLDEVKASTGITLIRLGYNRNFGYYLELPKGQVDKAPSYFYRKQTLVNGERYTTDKLIEYEKAILCAKTDSEEREKFLYEDLLKKTLHCSSVLNSISTFISTLDVYQGLATLALDSNYVCPNLTDDNVLEIKNGRHPVVEKQLGSDFVPNSLDMSTKFCLITGPNMAGKSTYLRQNAIIILLAHIGSYVPADEALIGLTDRIFCRVGASDNLARGQSTFLIEMQETAFILKNCTRRSFVIVDEIGRGTSTQDGMSIAYAVMQKLISIGPKTLFATHYHELTMLDNKDVRLLTLEVEENKGNVRFLRKVIDGVANSSYGIHVAKLGGVPKDVIQMANSYRCKHFEDYSSQQENLFTSYSQDAEDSITNENSSAIEEKIKNIDLNNISPMQALLILSSLKEEIDKDI